jgi:hypothetical protein
MATETVTMTATFHSPDRATTALFLVLVVIVLAAFFAAVRRGAIAEGVAPGPRLARTIAATLVWLAVLASVVASGAVARSPMPLVLVFLAASNVMALVVALSPVGRSIARGVPLFALVAFQGFRLPLEFVLHDWVRQGSVPATMTWTGANYDVVSGFLALALAPFAPRWRAAAWIANLVGFALLINVARVAILSSPLPFGWHVEPPLVLAAYLPYALIVPVCVAGALAGHVVLTRALFLPRAAR